jgi:alpha-L-fucosidase
MFRLKRPVRRWGVALMACVVGCWLLAVAARSAVAALPGETKQEIDQRMAWWREAKFGMFIHWGLYAVPAGEWQGKRMPGAGEWIMEQGHIPREEYAPLQKQFNPVKFDARQWVAIAKAAGMKYIVITSKHHDGFCLFDSKLTDYDVMGTPFGRDVLKELADECHKQGIQICWYHSIMDWYQPDAKGKNFPKYAEHLRGQLKELLTNYGRIGVLWFDGEWINEWTEQQGRDLEKYIRGLQPELIVNNRVGKRKRSPGDFGTPEQEIPATGTPGWDWETCMTMNGT